MQVTWAGIFLGALIMTFIVSTIVSQDKRSIFIAQCMDQETTDPERAQCIVRELNRLKENEK